MQSAIAQSVQYASQKATSDAQAALLTAQKAQVEAETSVTVEKLRGETYTVDYLMPSQLNESIAKVSSLQAEASKVEAEKLVMSAKAVSEVSNKSLIDAQVSKVAQENQLIAQQVVTEQTKRELLDAQKNDTTANLAVKTAEVNKTAAEVSLIQAKVLTEAKQPDAVTATAELTRAKAITEVSNRDSLAAQTTLYKTQAAAFKGKQSLDAASKMIDGVTMLTTSKVPPEEVTKMAGYVFGNSGAIQSAMGVALEFPNIN
jgi:hypothetical protein